MYSMDDNYLPGKDRWTEQAMDRYEQQVQVRQDERFS